MRKSSLGIVLPLFLLAACSTSVDDAMMDDDAAMEGDSSSAMSVMDDPFLDDEDAATEDDDVMELTVSSSSEATAEEPSATGPRVIAMTVTDWEFSPSTITVNQGEDVTLSLTGDKGIHGFAIPALGINVRIEAGKTTTVDLPTDTPGTFDARCSIPCGQGHSTMKATIIVQ